MRRKEETSHHQQLITAKRAYKLAVEEGNRHEEARWANLIGDILKNRGEYVEALRWLRRDYEVSIRYLPQKQLLATCQSLGELHLRLQHYGDALVYQKKHLDLAKDENDLIEQQRASTQLGRTYHEMFLRSEDDHSSIRNAKKYFELALKLARAIKEKPPSERFSFVKEYIDAHNNLGMLELDLDKSPAEICNEEEVPEDDATRSRLHHNLGNVCLDLRKWETAREHIKKDILICNQIGHCQGEAKGYIIHGELHYRNQRYEETITSNQKALDLAKTLEDEVVLTKEIHQNIKTVKEAMKVMSEIKTEELNLKKLERNTEVARGTDGEQKFLLKQNTSLDCLVEKSRMISDWIKLGDYGKRKMKIANDLSDKEKLSGSFLVIGESYQKLRKFSKALEWYQKGWETFRLIGNLEGQVLAKIHIGDVLDGTGDWFGALQAFREGYSIALNGNLSLLQLTALENMHYCHMIRFDDAEEARKTKSLIDKLKQSKDGEIQLEGFRGDCCSETKTELDNLSADDVSDGSFSPNKHKLNAAGVTSYDANAESDDDITLNSFLRVKKGTEQKRPTVGTVPIASSRHCGSPAKSISRSSASPKVSRKRARVILSDDEYDNDENSCSDRIVGRCLTEGIASSDELSKKYRGSPDPEVQQHIMFKIDKELVYMDPNIYAVGGKINMEQMKVDLACFYYLQLSHEKRSRGLVPVIQHMKCGEKILDCMETLSSFKDHVPEKTWIEVSVDVMVPKHVMKLYIDCCEELSESPNLEVMRRLYNLEVSEDEILVSDCQLRDVSVAPLLNALQMHKTLAVLDLSHNLLGNGSVENLRQVFMSSGQSYGGLILNLHNNRLGPAALFQICECPVLYERLEVLNISGNSLTDACASYLSTIIRNCKALYSLNIEDCSVTSRTIQKVADSLDSESALTHLFIGHNHTVSGNAVINLLHKLTATSRFQELSLNGIKLSKPVVDSLCQLARDCCLSGLFLGNTSIGNEGAKPLIKPLSKDTQELVRLDLSNCALTHDYIASLKDEASLVCGILELNLGGNPIMKEGSRELASLLRNPQCCLRVVVVCKCELGLVGFIQMLQALSENQTVEELNLAENINPNEIQPLTSNCRSGNETDPLKPAGVDGPPQELCGLNTSDNQLEVADSEDEQATPDRCTSANPDRSMTMREFIASIEMARSLKILDLSGNGLSKEVSDVLFSAWSAGGRAGLAQQHVEENTIHYSLQGYKCCGIKSCCRKI